MTTIFHELRLAFRRLSNAPLFAVSAILLLAIGVGASTAMFSVVDGVLLKPIPYGDPDTLVRVYHSNPERAIVDGSFSPQDFEDLKQVAAYSSVAAYDDAGMDMIGQGEPARIPAALVSGDFFKTLAVNPIRGRGLGDADMVEGGNRQAVISEGMWRRIFNADDTVIGRTVTLDAIPFTIVGVMPAKFQFPTPETDIWAPITLLDDDDVPHKRGIRWMSVIGRLANGVTPQAAEAQTQTFARNLAQQYADTNAEWTGARVPVLQDEMVGDVKPALLLLLASVIFVLLIACANLANVLLARGVGRLREAGIRVALGASRGRLIRELIMESLTISLIGGAAGILAANWLIDAMSHFAAGVLPRASEIAIDLRVALFGLALSVVTGVFVGIFPALRISSTSPKTVIGERGAGEHHGSAVLRKGFVVAQVGLAAMLLIGSGLVVRSLIELMQVDPGFRADRVLHARIVIPEIITEQQRHAQYRNAIFEAIKQLPEVEAVGAGKTMPLAGGGEPYAYALGPGQPDDLIPRGGTLLVSRGYFEALSIPVIAGRTFTLEDEEKDRLVLVVNQAFADQYFPDGNALGQKLYLGDDFPLEIAGIVGNVRSEGLDKPPVPAAYGPAHLFPRSSLNLFIKTSGDPMRVAGSMRSAIWSVEKNQPIGDIATMQQRVTTGMAQPRLLSMLMSFFGVTALLLAAVGTYAQLAYTIQSRTREIGIRMALGAQPAMLVKMVVGSGLKLALIGVAIGVVGALVATRLISSVLYGVSAYDVATYSAACVMLIAVALMAAWFPARRAASVEPVTALRYE